MSQQTKAAQNSPKNISQNLESKGEPKVEEATAGKKEPELHNLNDTANQSVQSPKTEAPFPVETSINGYAFMRYPAKVMEALNIQKTKRADGKQIYLETKATIQSYDPELKVLIVKLA